MNTPGTTMFTLILQLHPGPTLSELYKWGGVPFMHLLTLLFLVNIGIFAYIIVKYASNKVIPIRALEAIKQIGTLALAWGVLSSLVGLFFAFQSLETSPEIIPFQVIMGGMKVALITVIYGLIVFCISLLAYIALNFMNRTEPAA